MLLKSTEYWSRKASQRNDRVEKSWTHIANTFKQEIEKCFLGFVQTKRDYIVYKGTFLSLSGLFLSSLRNGAHYLLVLKILKLFFKEKAIYDYVLLLLQRYDTIS